MARAVGYRLSDAWDPPATPEEVVDRISPVPLIVVHGLDDHVFDVDEALRLYDRAEEPKRLMLCARFGHAEDGLSASFAERIAARILDVIEE